MIFFSCMVKKWISEIAEILFYGHIHIKLYQITEYKCRLGLNQLSHSHCVLFCNKKKMRLEILNTILHFCTIFHGSVQRQKKGNNKETRLPFFGVVETMNRWLWKTKLAVLYFWLCYFGVTSSYKKIVANVLIFIFFICWNW